MCDEDKCKRSEEKPREMIKRKNGKSWIDFKSSQRTLSCDADGLKVTYLATRQADWTGEEWNISVGKYFCWNIFWLEIFWLTNIGVGIFVSINIFVGKYFGYIYISFYQRYLEMQAGWLGGERNISARQNYERKCFPIYILAGKYLGRNICWQKYFCQQNFWLYLCFC